MKYLLLLILFSCTDTVPPPVVIPPATVVIFGSTHSDLYYPINCANQVIVMPEFLKEIESVEKFDYSDDNGKVVADFIRNMQPVEVKYYTGWLWSKVIAMTYPDKREILLNTRKHPRPLGEVVNSIIHESLHIKDDSGKYFTHGSNYATGKGRSIPYWVGDLAEKYSKFCKNI